MVPKKLTDCPENLREAIDWLIQVRHGGGGSDGLGELSKALQKLIEEAIEKAYTTNVGALLKILDSAKSYTCCEGKVAEIRKLKDSKNLTPETFENLKSKCEDINNCTKNHLDSSQQKSYDEIESKLEQLKKLGDSLNGFTDERQCKDLLTHLCDGLQTFLGFNPDSKGYDGKGIVYSDLDRLCDGVMGFLYQTMKMIVTDPNVITYYDSSSEYVKILEKHLDNGHHGFSMMVSAMLAWHGYYEKEFSSRVKAIVDNENGKLTALRANIKTNINEVGKLKDLSTKPFEVVVDEWKETVTRGLAISVKNAESAINNLDKPLRNEIMVEFDKIKMQIDKLNESTVRDVKQLNDLARQVNFDLNELKKSVYFAIHTRVGDLRKKLTEDFTAINEEINTVSVTLGQYVEALKVWIQNAQSLVDKAIPQIEAILNEIDDNGSKGRKYPATIKKQAGELKRKADALWSATGEVKRVLKPLGQNIRSAVDTLESVYKKTLKDLQQAVQSQVHEAQRVLGELGSKVKSDLGNDMFQRPIKEEIGKVMSAFKGGIGKARQASDWAVEIVQGFREGLAYDYNSANDRNTWLYKWADSTQSDIRNVVEKLGDLSKFRAVLNALESSTHDGKNFFEVITEDLYKKLTEAINAIKGELPRRMSNYNNHAKMGGAIHNAIGKVKEDVNGFFYVDGSREQQVRQDKLEGYNRNGVDDEINKIESEGLQHFKKFDQPDNEIKNNTFNELKSAITSNLEGLIEAIKQNADHNEDNTGIKQKLEALQNTYFKQTEHVKNDSIYKIYADLETLQTVNLAQLISMAQTFLVDTIPKQAKECITAIKNHLKAEVIKTVENIKMDALERYIESKSQELGVFKKCVDRRCDTITAIIDEDIKRGIKGLLAIVKQQLSGTALQIADQTKLGDFPSKVQFLLEAFWGYVGGQLTGNDDDVLSAFVGVKTKMTTLFTDLTHYNHEFKNNLHDFSNALSNLKPEHFCGQSSPLLDVFKKGCESMIGELRKAYVAAYSGAFSIDWKGPKTDEISQNGINCAEIFFTILVFIYKHFMTLNEKCGEKGEWLDKKICLLNSTNAYNSLGDFLEECGFHVTEKEDTPDNELRCHGNMKGSNMIQRLTQKQMESTEEIKHIQKCSTDKIEKSKKQFNFFDILHCMFTHLEEYYSLCHIANPSSKQPCSVFEMLNWLAGLHYTAVYPKLLRAGIESVFVKSDKQKNKSIESLQVTVVDQESLSLAAYPNNITYYNVKSAIEHICSKSYIVLTSIVGTGNSATTYAVNFCTNSLGLKYPISGEDCLHTVIDICRKVIPPLRFLQTQCKMSAQHGGWEQCGYGKDVPSAKWPCTENAIDQPTCQPTSPLMSYLNDCLPGHLPHLLTSVGCKSECKTCPSGKPGMPCITPLGFRGFSGSTSTGRDLCDILNELLDDVDLSALLCVVPKPPSTLPEHFGFALTLVHGWYDGAKKIKNSFQRHVYDAITKQSISLYHDPGVLTDALRKAYCSQPPNCGNEHKNAEHSDVFSLSLNNYTRQCSGENHCAHYIYSLSSDSHYYIANKHASVCLSWALYLPWQFHTYLNSLLQELKEIFCRDWECSKCLHGKKCKPGHHGVIHTKTQNSSCQCDSVVRCRGVLPTLYKYGFTFGDPSALNDVRDPKTCSNFCSQLEKVIKSSYFTVLFNECDNFLWTIRLPFSYLLLTLWLLSLLYLIHILIIRLDLLHIKSHLRSPSSHRIAAQSLLAAARVGKLAKISYLQT
ncbi:hypothetical protein BBBOND_0305020 [Babesia bigemina]|uniref:C3H1-type domain-containing protein n=1 Tax=Babesia bigemina TaxID=5866 RepID=A0A061DCA4_BABBI|nr:hypothetical protein BBBOND_0305020 [Babesia bigemina]CDR96599.1 hypothetical protein BBBOND_0305020 [Babesia bigemina]|eukprot:XP_012768785.1 hypothetical protein BBBOND_0305020 [Babesia bigemina]